MATGVIPSGRDWAAVGVLEPPPPVDFVVGVEYQCQASIFNMIQMPVCYFPVLAIKIDQLAEAYSQLAVNPHNRVFPAKKINSPSRRQIELLPQKS